MRSILRCAFLQREAQIILKRTLERRTWLLIGIELVLPGMVSFLIPLSLIAPNRPFNPWGVIPLALDSGLTLSVRRKSRPTAGLS